MKREPIERSCEWQPIPPACPATGWPQFDDPALDMCSCGHRHIKITAWGAGGGERAITLKAAEAKASEAADR